MLTLKETNDKLSSPGEFTNASLHEMDQRYYLPTFKRYPIALARGLGSTVWDVEGNEY